MNSRGRRTARLWLCLLCAVFTVEKPGSAEAAEKTLRVASKTFTESVILAEIVCDLERAAGVETTHRAGLGGTRLVWDALVDGSIDVYPEYTGTLLNEILAAEGAPARAPEAETRAFITRALARHGVAMTEPLGFNNTYAVGLTSARARQLAVQSISDLRDHANLRFGFSNEFMSRHDGWPSLRERYGLPQSNVQGLDHDLAYRALTSGAIDAMDLYTTDAEVRRYALLPLDDDLRFFQRYDAVLLYRTDVRSRIGQNAVDALLRLQGRIDAVKMASMNARAKLERVPESRVANGFVNDEFNVALPERTASWWQNIVDRTLEHLALVGVSLLAAIVIALPLGIVAQRKRRLGQVVLALVGVVQTLPTLALLVFMIPLFGIGGLPAVVALFLYSLLPIVRNTHAGLAGVPESLLESARALGLPSGAILRRVELPLASPLILAGIKSAAVINVGTATLGALIGAGGLGQPIFSGIRLDDMGLILQGAIPASVLALVVQGAFELVERYIVPRGLRLPRPR
jgi:osmoprotectant transport system permease protein